MLPSLLLYDIAIGAEWSHFCLQQKEGDVERTTKLRGLKADWKSFPEVEILYDTVE